MLVSQVMVTDTVQWFWDPAIEWSECLHGGEKIAKKITRFIPYSG